MQHEITVSQPLLDRKGHIQEEGWARQSLWQYDRTKIHAGKLRIKEWDYYAVMSHQNRFCITATISDLGYAAMFALAFIDLNEGKAVQVDAIKAFTLGKTGLPQDSGDYSVAWANEEFRLAFSRKGDIRRLLVAAPHMVLPHGLTGLDADITLIQPPQMESINIATSWADKRTAFYLNEKVNCMPAGGMVRLGDTVIDLGATEAFGTLDWGRGNWTYRNRWYWGSASGQIKGVPFGFNIGYGFTDRSPASENAIFHNGRIHKLDEVVFHIPASGYTDPWKFTSSDGRFEMDFQPIVDRSSLTNALVIKSVQHQVFGRFSGKAVLDDGTIVAVEDFLGFAEDVYNRY